MKEGPRSTKMYHGLRKVYSWRGMNKGIVDILLATQITNKLR